VKVKSKKATMPRGEEHYILTSRELLSRINWRQEVPERGKNPAEKEKNVLREKRNSPQKTKVK